MSSTPPNKQAAEALAAMDAVIVKLAAAPAASAGPIWGEAHQRLLKAKADPKALVKVVMTRDLDGLRHLVAQMRGEETAPEPAPEPAATLPTFDPEELDRALRAFKRRLKLMILDHESKLGVGPMSGGHHAEIDAILPPQEFPAEIWDVLAHQGVLKAIGRGFYALRG